MKKITLTVATALDLFNIFSNLPPKELEEAKKDDFVRSITRLAKIVGKLELPEFSVLNSESAAAIKAARKEVAVAREGKTEDEATKISDEIVRKLNQELELLNERHGKDSFDTKEATVLLSDDEHALLSEILAIVGKSKYANIKSFAAALGAVECAVEAEA